MSDHVKFLPPAAIPEGGAATWSAEDAERWRAAGPPAVFAPNAGSWVLWVLVFVSIVLVAWNEPEAAVGGTGWEAHWEGYPEAVLMVGLPLAYRLAPWLTLVMSGLLGALMLLSWGGVPVDDAPARAGTVLLLALSVWTATGAWFRLRARRRQGALALAAAGERRVPVPDGLPASHRLRGLPQLLSGVLLCLAGAGLLVWGAVAEAGAGTAHPYDPTGQQVIALLALAPGMPLLARGMSRQWAARRLHAGPQPVLVVGVRADTYDHSWLYPNASDTTGRPLIGFRDRFEDMAFTGRTLVGGAEERLRADHHDVNEYAEPYEALLYGVPREGAEVVMEFADFYGDTRIGVRIKAVPLLARRRHSLYGWQPAGTSYTLAQRAEREARRERQRASSSSSSDSGGCGSSGDSCGSSCGSSCGGGCGGGD
ncbi:hypothetical protein [Streptomyces sp. NPDC086023]|uniref:hypothetical protein n=1 Tax=Streptomyces sp. NPDC086023 TaxID=3365746 RepID=UPI0037D8FC7A